MELLDGLDFVFLCLDRGPGKRAVVERLCANGTPFVEVGMGVFLDDGQLGGIVRADESTPETRDRGASHFLCGRRRRRQRVRHNIQIAELNALNAAHRGDPLEEAFRRVPRQPEQVYSGFSIATGEIVRKAPDDAASPSSTAVCGVRSRAARSRRSLRLAALSTAPHFCCCGCGCEVVTPLNPAKWRLAEEGQFVVVALPSETGACPASPTIGSPETE